MARALIGIVGPPGSGKTHLARFLCERRLVAAGADAARVVAMDGFHLSNSELERLGRRGRKGAPDTFDAVGFVDLLERVRDCQATVWAPAFSRELDEPIAEAVAVEPAVPLVLVEGNYLLLQERAWRDVQRLLDLTVYVETPADERRRRLLARQARTHGSRLAAERWIDTVDDPNAAVVEATKHRADRVVSGLRVPGPPVW